MKQNYTAPTPTPSVTAVRLHYGTADIFDWPGSRCDDPDKRQGDELGPLEQAFIASRDGFYLAAVSETGVPYVQFRGGAPGFLRVLGPTALGFDASKGNPQYITAGNDAGSDGVALFLTNYATRERLNIFGRMEIVDTVAGPDLASSLGVFGCVAPTERVVIIKVAAFDWTRPQPTAQWFTWAGVCGPNCIVASAAASI